jgi:hypothetical protein
VMQADGVDQRELDALLARVASARRAAGGRDNATDRRSYEAAGGQGGKIDLPPPTDLRGSRC